MDKNIDLTICDHEPLVTVLLPVYNAERHLQEALSSIVNQSYKNLEILVINDGSTDSSEEIILRCKDTRIRYVKNAQNLKLIKTLNIGLELANGEYVARMDADDIAFPSRIEEQIKFALRNNNEINSVFAYYITEGGRFHSRREYFCTQPNSVLFASFFESPLLHPGVLAKSDLLRKYMYSDKTDSFAIEDYELWTRMLADGVKFFVLPQYLMSYRRTSSGESYRHNEEQVKNHISIARSFIENQLDLRIDLESMVLLTKRKVGRINIEQIFNSWAVLDTIFTKHCDLNCVNSVEKQEIRKWIEFRKLDLLIFLFVNSSLFDKFRGLLLIFKFNLFHIRYIRYFNNLVLWAVGNLKK